MCSYSRTDAGNAEFFASVNSELRYDHSRKRWLVFRKHWWTEDRDGLVYRLAKSVARMRMQLALQMPEGEEKGHEERWAIDSESRARLEAMLKLAESEFPLFDSGEGWDADPWLLGVANGVVDLRTGQVREGQQSDKITVHSEIPFDSSAQCPRWEQFLRQIFGGDQLTIEYLHRAVGYCLSAETREQCLFLCHGTGANGKSTFLEVLRRVWSGYAYNLPFSAFELRARSSIPNDIAAIAGKRLITAIETNESAQLNEARIKMLTGSDPVTARHLYREYFTFPPTAKLWLAFNHLPEVADDSHGFWRRIRLIPFLQCFAGDSADKDLLPKLLAEAPGILAWAVRGCLDWQANGLGAPPNVVAATDAYRRDSDLLDDFVAERCLVSPTVSVSAAALWEAYCDWASLNLERTSLDRRSFSRRLEAKGFKKARWGRQRTWTWFGICLRNDANPEYPVAGAVPRTDADVNSYIVST